MTDLARADRTDELGPVDFIAVEFPDGVPTRAGFDQLLALSEAGVVRVLDLEFVEKAENGDVQSVTPTEISARGGIDLGVWEGASSGLLDAEDVAQLGAESGPGALTVVAVFENRWVLSLVDSWRRNGARLIAEGGVPASDIVAALDSTEAAPGN